MRIPSLPKEARRLCAVLHAPPELIEHLRLVHAASVRLTTRLTKAFPTVVFDEGAVLFGAATHDLGKVIHLAELFGPGNRHEVDGPSLLMSQGVPCRLARFAGTHGSWERNDMTLEDLLVALADQAWREAYIDGLQERVARAISTKVGIEPWEAFCVLAEL